MSHAHSPLVLLPLPILNVIPLTSSRRKTRLPVITPVTQHRRLNTQLSRHLRQWSTTRRQQ